MKKQIRTFPFLVLATALLFCWAIPESLAQQAAPPKAAPATTKKYLKTADIPIRDPFILADQANKTYYLYAQMGNRLGGRGNGKGVEAYTSHNLEDWEGPFPVFRTPNDFWAQEAIWAPEVHPYKGKYFLFATFTAADTLPHNQSTPGGRLQKRGTQILVADSPLGPFRPFANRPHTPTDWMALDGTLYVENEQLWMVFCHEWLQITDGTMEAVRLKQDLSAPEGEPLTLFKATEALWVRNIKDVTGGTMDGYITDGPYLHQTKGGKLLMIWSSFGENKYALGVAVSESGKVTGPWTQVKEPLFKADGGHGMIFKTFENTLMLVFHQPNTGPMERVKFFQLREKDDRLELY